MKEDWKELSDDEFIDASDREIFEWYLSDTSAILMEMSNVRGRDVIMEDKLPFSFFFCRKSAVHRQHGIRLKIIWNPNRAPEDADGYIELHGDYEYTMGSHKYKPTAKELSVLRNFCKKYKVLFAAVWEGILYDGDLQDYFKGRIDLRELLTNFDLRGISYYKVNHCKTLQELEDCVRKNKIFNMND